METNDVLVKSIGKHSVYKFELIEHYVEEWAQKLLNNEYCSELVFIDCMSNCGEYIYDGSHIYGTPVRVSRLLSKVAEQYPKKKITLYFNDFDQNKINYLSTLLPPIKRNFSIILSAGDGNDLIKELGKELIRKRNVHYLLIYDPFDANIDWYAIKPFLNRWGEVIINHMASDPMRAVKVAKTENAINKYEKTYLCPIEELLPNASDRATYEKRISEIITTLRTNKREYYIALFPFFNSKNVFEYDLVFFTSNIYGFKLFKKKAWKVFKDHSSNKQSKVHTDQYKFDLYNDGSRFFEDTDCYSVNNIVEYIYKSLKGKGKVSLKEVWQLLDEHPIFPSEGYRTEIKTILNKEYGVEKHKDYLIFKDEEL